MSSPNGTFGKSIVDSSEQLWVLGPNGEACQQATNGVGSLYCWYNNAVYIKGSDNRWYVWVNNNHWELYGDNPPTPIPVPVLPRLITRGAFFAVETGEYYTIIESTDFRLFQMFLNKEDVSPILEQRRNLGFNTLRILGMCHNMFRLYPQEHPDYYTSLAPFMGLCAQYGLRVEFTVFADATIVMPNKNDQMFNWTMVGSELVKASNVIVEAVNEADQPVNHLASINDLKPIDGLLCSHGSNGSQQVPVRPWWNYETFHTNDAFEWQRKVGHNAMELSDGAENLPGSHVPILTNENTRPDRDGNPDHFYDGAAGAALLCAGSCFHSDSGKFSRLFTGQDLEFAKLWVSGARMVLLICQDGMYIRHEPGDYLRVYERRLPTDAGFIVNIRK